LTPPTVSSADAAAVFKDMLVARRAARTATAGLKEAPNSMLDGTVRDHIRVTGTLSLEHKLTER
jgi:hypothetical protein